MDEERHRISLGMKNLDIVEDNSLSEESDEAKDDSIDDSDSELGGNMLDSDPIPAAVESREPFALPVVILDDMEQFCPDVELVQNEKQIDGTDNIDEKKSRRARKKAKQERSLMPYPFLLSTKLWFTGFPLS